MVSRKPFIKIWDITNNKLRFNLALPYPKKYMTPEFIRAVRFLPDGDSLLAIGEVGGAGITPALFDLRSAKAVTEPVFLSNSYSPVILPDGRTIAFNNASEVEVYDVSRAQKTAVLLREREEPLPIALSFNKRIMAITDKKEHPFIEWIDTATGLSLRKLEGYSTPESGKFWATVAAFSPDNRLFAVEIDHVIFLWEVATGKLLAKLVGHGKDVHALAFSPDGWTLASISRDDTIRLWDMNNLFPKTVARP